MKKYQLMAPGPTPVPSEVLLAMARPIIHHRTPEYAALFTEIRAGLKRLVQTRQEVLTPADRKSTRLNSSHSQISYAVFCLKKKNSNRHHSRLPQNNEPRTTRNTLA